MAMPEPDSLPREAEAPPAAGPARAEERRVIEACRQGDRAAFRTLFETHQRRAYAVAYNILNDAELAKDVVQEAYIRVFRNIRRFDPERSFYTWLYQIVVNLSIDFLRKRASSRAVSLEVSPTPLRVRGRGPVETASKEETRCRVQEILNRLPRAYKVALALRDIQGFSCEEIAEIVQCKNSTVRWRIHQARKLFKALWEGEEVDLRDHLDDGEPDDL